MWKNVKASTGGMAGLPTDFFLNSTFEFLQLLQMQGLILDLKQNKMFHKRPIKYTSTYFT